MLPIVDYRRIFPKIVGWAVGPTLETIYPLQALRMALNGIDERTASMLIHHSDKGCQYCSAAYVHELKKRKIAISMTQSGDPLENAIAEHANGIIICFFWDILSI